MVISNIQTKISAISDLSKICSFEVEFQDSSTTTLIHSTARLLLFKKGKGKFMINGVEYLIEKNTMISILPWDITTITDVTEDLEFYKIVYNFQIINDDLKNICNFRKNQINSIEVLSKNPIKILDSKAFHDMKNSFIEIKDEVGNDSFQEEIDEKPYSDEYLISSIIRILIKFLRFENKNEISTKQNYEHQIQINQILRYMYSHMSEKLTLDRLASTFFISKSGLTNKCNQPGNNHRLDYIADGYPEHVAEKNMVKMYVWFDCNIQDQTCGKHARKNNPHHCILLDSAVVFQVSRRHRAEYSGDECPCSQR